MNVEKLNENNNENNDQIEIANKDQMEVEIENKTENLEKNKKLAQNSQTGVISKQRKEMNAENTTVKCSVLCCICGLCVMFCLQF